VSDTEPSVLLSLLGLGAAGYAIGFVGGMVGLVLGVIRLPVVYFYGLSPAMAAGTNIGVSAVGAVAGSVRHVAEGRVDYGVLVIMAASSAIGAFIGAYYSWAIAPWLLLLMIGLVVSNEGFSLARTPRANASDRHGIERAVRVGPSRVAKELALGFAIGLLGGMVGLILGTLRLPAMIRVLKMDPRIAVGTNLSVGAIMGVSGFVGHMISRDVEWGIFLAMGIGAMIGGYMGAKYTGRVEAYRLKRMIGYVMLAVSVSFFWEAYRLYP